MTSPVLWVALYCLAVFLASLAGGWIPHLLRLTHTRLQLALSFVAGVMLGVGLLHLLPHGYFALEAAKASAPMDQIVLWLVVGFLSMFFLERFFQFHHHDAPAEDADAPHDLSACVHHHDHAHDHAHEHLDPHHQHPPHRFSWMGALLGMTLHGLIDGVALAASVQVDVHDGEAIAWAGIGTFLAIFLHKPFDALTIGTLMAAEKKSAKSRHWVNFFYAAVTPLGAVLFMLGLGYIDLSQGELLGCVLGFAAGAFLCIATSDLLPELQFHSHDRFKLSFALILGVVVAWGIVFLEESGHDHGGHTHSHSHDHKH